MFLSIFSREIDWEWSQICQSPQSHAHRDVDNVNQAETLKWVSHILKNTRDMFLSIFSREIDWEWYQICQSPEGHAHRRRQPCRVPQVGTSY